MSKVKYIAVTLGPIFKTIGLAESTGALWAASYMFSYLSKSICEYLLEHSEFNISEEDIIVPYYHKTLRVQGMMRLPRTSLFRTEWEDFPTISFSARRILM